MNKNIKNLIAFGIFAFGFFGMQSIASAMATSNYPIDDSYGYTNYSYQNNYSGYTNYSNSNYSNDYYNNNGYYNNSYQNGNNNNNNNNTGYVSGQDDNYNNTNQSPSQTIVYVSQPTNTQASSVASKSTSKNTTVSKSVSKTDLNTESVDNTKDVSVVTGSGSDLGNSRIVALSAYGTSRFFPDTIMEWIMVFFLILIIIILFRLITKKNQKTYEV